MYFRQELMLANYFEDRTNTICSRSERGKLRIDSYVFALGNQMEVIS